MYTLRKKKKEKVEEYHTGKTADLRNVISEIQKVDQETADLSGVVEEAKKINTPERKDTSITCRLLFYSVIDKIFLFLLVICFLVFSFLNFKGPIFSVTYGFWFRVFREIGIILFVIICGLFLNWIYRCISKTSLVVQYNGIYRECFFPFIKRRTTIPLKHVSSISTITILWIFRAVVIFQYHHLPIVFPTWNHEKFKKRVEELLGQDVPVMHYSNKSIYQRKYNSFTQWFLFVVFSFIIVLGIAHFIGYFFSTERSIVGTYLKGNQKIVLNMNGTCNLKLTRVKNLKRCKWIIDKNENRVEIQYEYLKENYYGEKYNKKESITVGYQDHSLLYNGIEFMKK